MWIQITKDKYILVNKHTLIITVLQVVILILTNDLQNITIAWSGHLYFVCHTRTLC